MLQDLARLHQAGRLDEAESGYRALLAGEPDNADALHLLGVLRRQREDYAEARLLLDRARTLAPQRADVLLELAGLHFISNDPVGARALLESAVKLDPNQHGAYTLLAQVAHQQGDAAGAETLFRTALRLDENDPHALAGLGTLMLERNDIDKALAYLTRSADVAPNQPLTQFALARALYLKGNAAFAEQAARNALAQKPELHAARHLLGQILLQGGRHDEAEATFAALSDAPNERATALFGLGDTMRARGRFDQAAERYAAALALQPRQPRAVHSLGWCLAALGRDREAVEVYMAYLSNHGESAPIEAALADHHMAMGRFDLALPIWRKLAESSPKEPLPVQRLALLHERLGDHVGAATLAEHVAPAIGNDAELTLLRARAAMREHREDAAETLLESLRGQPLSPAAVSQAAHLFGVLCDRRDDVTRAVPSWLEAQANSPAAFHAQDPVPAELAARLAEPSPPVDLAAPVFLLGLPGSMVERVAALLHEQPGVTLLRDRAFAPQRGDDFTAPEFERYLAGADRDDAQQRAQHYRAEIARIGVDPASRVVDWLVRWDARFLPLIRDAFPGATLIVVERDERDLLVNWLAYGWLPGFPLHEPLAAARWLKAARSHFDAIAGVAGLNIIRVDADALLADPQRHGAAVATALGLSSLTTGAPQVGLGGLNLGLPAGRWNAYALKLAPAFAALAE